MIFAVYVQIRILSNQQLVEYLGNTPGHASHSDQPPINIAGRLKSTNYGTCGHIKLRVRSGVESTDRTVFSWSNLVNRG